MQVRTRKTSRSTVVGVTGSVSRAELPRLRGALDKAIQATETSIVVDVRRAEDIELAFVQVVVSALRTAAVGDRKLWVRDSEGGPFASVVNALGLEEDLAFRGEREREGAPCG